MDENRPNRRAVTEQEIREWLTQNFARHLNIPAAEIDATAPFTRYGMDSQQGATLQGELETWLGRELSPTLVWDHPSIEKVAKYLAGKP